ncbi:MAG: hypothetical protein ACXVEF_43385 [Polyangiales bacterium]
MKTHLLFAVCCVAFIGCQDKKTEPSPKAESSGEAKKSSSGKKGPTGTPRPQTKLTVTLDGKPVPMATALAWKSWDGSIQITASSVPVGCSEVTGDMRAMHEGEVTFDVFASQGLQPDGSYKGQLRSTYFSGMNSQSSKLAALTGDGSPGAPTTIDVDFETTSAGSDKETLVVKGTIDALGCAAPVKNVPPPPAPMAATIEVAGKKLPVRFARWSTQGDTRSLELFTGSEACKQVPFSPPSELRVRFVWFKPNEPKVSQMDASGSLVAQASDQTFDQKKVTFKPMPNGPGDTELHADVKLSGYPVKVDGKVTVTECPKD